MPLQNRIILDGCLHKREKTNPSVKAFQNPEGFFVCFGLSLLLKYFCGLSKGSALLLIRITLC